MKARDGFIDGFKGLLILWVIHLHTVFWSGELYLSEGVRQKSLLIDIAAFFFISGYLVGSTDVTRSLRKFAKQFFRLYGGYIIISAIVLLLLIVGRYVVGSGGLPLQSRAFTSVLLLEPAGSLWDQIRVYNGSLWFIRVYLSMLVFLPALVGLVGVRRLRIPLLIALLVAFCMLRYQGWNREFLFIEAVYVAFYLTLFMLGTIYRAEEHAISVRWLVLSIPATALLCLAAYAYDGGQLVLQDNKFPPTLQYLAYSLPLILLFVLAKRVWRAPEWKPLRFAGRFLTWSGRNVYSLYLFQGVACSLPYLFVRDLRENLPAAVLYVVVLIFNVVLATVLTGSYVALQRTVARRFRRAGSSGYGGWLGRLAPSYPETRP